MVTNSESSWQINYVQFHAMGEDIGYMCNLKAFCIDLHDHRGILLPEGNKKSLRKAQDFKNIIVITIHEKTFGFTVSICHRMFKNKYVINLLVQHILILQFLFYTNLFTTLNMN